MRILVYLMILALLVPKPAYAYIDPGLGSIIFQSIVGALAITGGLWYSLKDKIKTVWQKLFSNNSKEQ